MKSRLKTLLYSLLATFVMLTAIELLARITSTIGQDFTAANSPSTEPWLVYSPAVGWERMPGFRGNVGHADREFNDAGYLTVDSKQIAAGTGKKRVIFLGDSNTFGFGAPTADSFVEVADGLLPDVDMINLGVVGYSSYQGRITLEKYLPLLKPDLVVVSFNFNDRRYVTSPAEIDGVEEFQRIYRTSQSTFAASIRFLEISYFYRGLRHFLRKAGLAPEPATSVNVTQLIPRVDEAAYHRNLSHIAETARRSGIPVLFVLLRDDPLLSEHLRKGVASLANHDYDAAVAYLNSTVRSRTMFSELARSYLAKAYEEKNDKTNATKIAVTSSIYRSFSGGTLIRLDDDYNEIMRKVAAENNMPLLNGAEILEAHPSVFIDFCHFNADGHHLLGIRLAERISAIFEGSTQGKAKGIATAR